VSTVQVLVVAGGGGGRSGGGGGGGMLYNAEFAVTPQDHTVIVGTGGAGKIVDLVTNAKGDSGTDSAFSTITAKGGGGGGNPGDAGSAGVGGDGGSSGGGGAYGSAQTYGGTPTPSPVQGHAGGGNGNYKASPFPSGGGGGAGGNGGDATGNSAAGIGGIGASSSISGAPVNYAGGGGGWAYLGASSGGTASDGGGAGKSSGGNAGTNGKGGGGGGTNSSQVGGNGGSGIVIVRYITGTLSAIGGIVTISGIYTIHTFTASGTFTVAATWVAQQGELLIATTTVDVSTGATATFQAGPDAVVMELNGLIYKGVLWAECGDIAWTITVTGLTPITGVYHVVYTPLSGVQVYQGTAQLNATAITLEEHVSPDYARCSFTLTGDLDPTMQIMVKSHGKRWRMIHRNDSANDDVGTITAQYVDSGFATLARQVTVAPTTGTSWSIVQLLGLTWAADYTSLLPLVITDAQWATTAVSTILQQIGLLNNVTFVLRDGLMYAFDQIRNPAIWVTKGRRRDSSGVINHVTEQYTTSGVVHTVDVYAAGWTAALDNPLIRTTDQWADATVATAFANALLTEHSVPVVSYSESVDWNTLVNIGDVVITPTGNLIVNGVVWDATSTLKTLMVGVPVTSTVEWIKDANNTLAALQRIV
jgi:hypothetical protein